MSYFFYTDNGLAVVRNREKVIEASEITFQEYMETNVLGLSAERANIYDAIAISINHGYPVKVKHLWYNTQHFKNEKKIITKDKVLKYDALNAVGIMVPIVKEQVAEIFKKYCGEKVQIIDVIVELQDGTLIDEYKAINTINRVEAFTWEGSVKKDNYDEYGEPHIGSLEKMAYKKEIVEREIICKDSITKTLDTMISDSLAKELKKGKFRGFRFYNDLDGRVRFV